MLPKSSFRYSIIIISIIYVVFSTMVILLFKKNQDIANKDFLTGLPNRKKFQEVMEQKILEARKSGSKIAVFFLDLDSFKEINDVYGHDIGDKVLQEAANKLKNYISRTDIVARIGGDEFGGLVSGIQSSSEIEKIGQEIEEAFDEYFVLNEIKIKINPSIGISVYPDHGEDTETLLIKSDDAMYKAKEGNLGYKRYIMD